MDDQISVIEDLTPEPMPRSGSTRGRDLVLGLFLIVVVTGFAGWQWWHQQDQSNNYEAGQQAIGRNDWQAARDYFTAASGYRDADALAARASEQIEQMDDLYGRSLAFERDQNWIAVMQTLSELDKIQDDYRGANAMLKEAQENVYSEALSGTVILRTKGNTSALYTLATNDSGGIDEHRLPNSDSYSRVQGGCADGKVLYDVAPTGASLIPTPFPGPFFVKGENYELKGRVLAVSNLSGQPGSDYRELPIDPSEYDQFLCGSTGMWLYDYGRWGFNGLMPELGDTPVRSVETRYTLTYLSFDSAISATLAVSDSVDARQLPVDIDYNSNRILLAKWSGEDQTSGHITPDTHIQLYLLQFDGVSEPRLIYETTGLGIESAEISPNGKYVLVNTFEPSPGPQQLSEREQLVLIDLANPQNPVTLAKAAADFGINQSNWLAATFVRQGAFSGDVLYSQFDPERFTVRVFDPANPDGTLAITYVDAFTAGSRVVSPMYWTVAQENDGGIVLVGREGIRDGLTLVAWSLAAVSISPDGQAAITTAITKAGYLRSYPFTVAANRVLYVSDYDSKDVDWSVWSMPIAPQPFNGDTMETTLAQAFTIRYPVPRTFLPYDKVGFGPGLMAYIDNGQLHARSYDGKYDVTLESGVPSLYDTWRYWWYDNELN